MKKTFLLSALLLGAVSARADDLTGRIGAGVVLGEAVPFSPKSVTDHNDSGSASGAWLRYGFSRLWSARLSYDRFSFAHGPTRMKPLMLSAGCALDPESNWNPTLHVGLGSLALTGAGSNKSSGVGATVGYGMDRFFWRHVSLGGAVDWVVRLNGGSASAFRLGLLAGVWFGSNPAPAVKAEPPPPPPAPLPPPPPPVAAPAAAPLPELPPAPAPVAPPEKTSIAISIQFEVGQAVVKAEYDDQLQKVADFLKAFPDSSAEIEGHTDDRGKAEANRALSQRRADAVRQALLERFGVDSSRLRAKGYGPDRPLADNATPEGRSLNRRVVATFTDTPR